MFAGNITTVALIALLALPAGWCAAPCCRPIERTATKARACCGPDATERQGRPQRAPKSPQARCCCARDIVPPTASRKASAEVAMSSADCRIGDDFGDARDASTTLATTAEPCGQGLHILQCVWRC
jgi:hypothetical protein